MASLLVLHPVEHDQHHVESETKNFIRKQLTIKPGKSYMRDLIIYPKSTKKLLNERKKILIH